MKILFAGQTDIGMKRKTNQDSICLSPENKFFAVADGMGGHNGGDIASQMSVKLLPEYISDNNAVEKSQLLQDSFQFVNNAIFQKSIESTDLKGMGTTLSAIMFSGATLNIANIGDSRTYLVAKNKIYQLSRDHSLVQQKLDIGIYNRQAAAKDSQKNVLIRTVGFEENVEADVFSYKVCKNDIFLICSDGLHGKVSDQDILFIINKHISSPVNATQSSLDDAAKELIAQANTNGGQDNISVILTIAQS